MEKNSRVHKILLVDDDDIFRKTLAKALARRGHQVIQFASVAETLESISDFTCTHAVLDLRMPARTGLELIQPLKEKFSPIKILVLTGYGSIATAVDAMKLGAFNYLSKPTNVDNILLAFDESDTDYTSAVTIPSLAEVQKEHIYRVLNDCDGNITHAAKKLGMHRRSLQRKLSN